MTDSRYVNALLPPRCCSHQHPRHPGCSATLMEPTEPSNPFVLLTAPETVFARLEYSDRLARLRRTICRPLDKPVLGKPVELRAFDEAIDIAEASYLSLIETK